MICLIPDSCGGTPGFVSLDEMVAESEWTVESVEDFEAIPDGPWDAYVQQTTQFRSWKEMQESASAGVDGEEGKEGVRAVVLPLSRLKWRARFASRK